MNAGHGDMRSMEILTARQMQVARLAATGLSNKEIARHLELSVHTVNDHFKAAQNRLGVSSRGAIIAIVAGLPADRGPVSLVNVRTPGDRPL